MENVKTVSVGNHICKVPFEFRFKDKITEGHYLLIYLGQDGQKFHIGYREFNNSSIREKFSENFIFEIPKEKPTVISFKDKLFTVNKVSNKDIEFVDNINS